MRLRDPGKHNIAPSHGSLSSNSRIGFGSKPNRSFISSFCGQVKSNFTANSGTTKGKQTFVFVLDRYVGILLRILKKSIKSQSRGFSNRSMNLQIECGVPIYSLGVLLESCVSLTLDKTVYSVQFKMHTGVSNRSKTYCQRWRTQNQVTKANEPQSSTVRDIFIIRKLESGRKQQKKSRSRAIEQLLPI